MIFLVCYVLNNLFWLVRDYDSYCIATIHDSEGTSWSMSTGYCCLGDSYAESAVMNKTRVLNVFVIIWRHSYDLSYAALLIVHLIFFSCPRNKKAQMRTLPKTDSSDHRYLHLVYFCCASYNLTKWPVSASFQVSLCTSLSAVQS